MRPGRLRELAWRRYRQRAAVWAASGLGARPDQPGGCHHRVAGNLHRLAHPLLPLCRAAGARDPRRRGALQAVVEAGRTADRGARGGRGRGADRGGANLTRDLPGGTARRGPLPPRAERPLAPAAQERLRDRDCDARAAFHRPRQGQRRSSGRPPPQRGCRTRTPRQRLAHAGGPPFRPPQACWTSLSSSTLSKCRTMGKDGSTRSTPSPSARAPSLAPRWRSAAG
mmetsp:Transcript_2779/g.8387  ORF Transcript_2779/g.8387 Transcript_2779/m.8387 type:complete len:226 (+) Transcript_2779:326-1003(+)